VLNLSIKYTLVNFYFIWIFVIMGYELNVTQMVCKKCKKIINPMEPHKIIMFVISDKFNDHFYEHVECPDNFTI